MNKKIVAVIAGVVALVGGLAAYSAAVLAPQTTEPEAVISSVDNARVYQEPQESVNETTTQSIEDEPASNGTSQQQVMAPNNGTIFANNTIITISKPVYENNTLIYQPVTVNLKDYSEVINQNIEVSDDDKIILDDLVVNEDQDEPDANNDQPKTAKTYELTISAKRIASENWSPKFTDDNVGMFVSVYDMKGKQVRTGFADEDGFELDGLKNRLYFVFPADCNDCNGSKNDVVFERWEDGSDDRPRLVQANSEITASYMLEVPKPSPPEEIDDGQQETVIPLPADDSNDQPDEDAEAEDDETETSAKPEITLNAFATTYVHGLVQINGQVVNPISGFDTVEIQVYAPNGTLVQSQNHDISTSGSKFQDSFFTKRQAGEGDYRVVATYILEDDITEELTFSAEFTIPRINLFAQLLEQGTIGLSGNAIGALAEEKIVIQVFGPDGQLLRDYPYQFSTKPAIGFVIGQDDVNEFFTDSGEYRFVATHLLTNATGEASLPFELEETETSGNSTNNNSNGNQTGTASSITSISDDGDSDDPRVAVSGDSTFVVWLSGGDIFFSKSDNGTDFGEPVEVSESDDFSTSPSVAADGENVYLVWEDYDDTEETQVMFRASNDGGDTFGEIIPVGNRTGEGADPEVGTDGNEVYVIWTSGAFEEFAGDILFASSSDDGSTFSEPEKLNEEWAEQGTLAVSGDTVYALWQEYSEREPSEANTTTAWISTSENGGAFTDPVEVLSENNGYIIDIAASGENVHVLWIDGSLYYTKSTDGGETFGDLEELGESDDVNRADIAVDGENVLVDAESSEETIFFHSSDSGESFEEIEDPSNGGDSYDILASDSDLYAVWSTDDGISFARSPY